MSDLQTNLQPTRQKGGQPGNHNAAKPPSSNSQPPSNNPPKKRGAPPGNNNALTHGFYSRRLKSRSLEGLDEIAKNSLNDEIEVMRVFSRKVVELGENVNDLAEAKSLLYTLSIATTAINRLVRTSTRVSDPGIDQATELENTLKELEMEWPALKRFGDQFRTPEQIANLDERILALTEVEKKKRFEGYYVDENGDPYPTDEIKKSVDEILAPSKPIPDLPVQS